MGPTQRRLSGAGKPRPTATADQAGPGLWVSEVSRRSFATSPTISIKPHSRHMATFVMTSPVSKVRNLVPSGRNDKRRGPYRAPAARNSLPHLVHFDGDMCGSLASSENPFRDPLNGMTEQTPKGVRLEPVVMEPRNTARLESFYPRHSRKVNANFLPTGRGCPFLYPASVRDK